MTDLMTETRLKAPRSWLNTDTHYLIALDSSWYRLVFDLLDTLNVETVGFMRRRKLKSALLPITTGSISSPMGLGSDSLPVQVDLFGVKSYLADSMQFMLEYGCRLTEQGCYYVMPSFRGEALDARHLAQFFHSEAEIAGDLDAVITFVEDYIRALAGAMLCEHGKRLARDFDVTRLRAVADARGDFPRMTFDAAAAALATTPGAVRHDRLGFRVLTPIGERALMQRMGGIVWVTHPDHLSVPFYQAYEPGQPELARCADLLMGIGETVGAGERHMSFADLEDALIQHGVEEEPYRWYLQMRRARPMRTAGFGLGTERFLCWVLGHDDVRDFQVVPRINGVAITP